MDAILSAQIWERLQSGRRLDDLDLGTIDGRIDLRKLRATPPTRVEGTAPMPGVQLLENLTRIRNATWRGLDFSTTDLSSLRLFDCVIEDCRFDLAKWHDLRMWGTTVGDSSFVGANLQSASLGGLEKDKRNSFRKVDFTKANLRGSAYSSALFDDCTFANTNLKRVEFNGSVFTNCVFEGVLEETIFAKHHFHHQHLTPNEMKGVDFRGATLRGVEFRGMDLESVKWPEDGEHLIIHDFVEALDRAVLELGGRTDLPSRQLTAYLGVVRRWTGPRQRTGVLHRGALAQLVGSASIDELEQLLTRH
jgi:uncharacterized protein YjbI with pentapeptide repeats